MDVRSLSLEELQRQFALWKQPAYRVSQLLCWLYERRVTTWDAMTNLPAGLRRQLGDTYSLYSTTLVKKTGTEGLTQKFLWRLNDGDMIESVLIPASPGLYGDASDRHTLCVSTQVGCAYGCRFCASGLDGWKRNLRPEEIVGQVLATERWHATQQHAARDANDPANKTQHASPPSPPSQRLINNLVIMGMGEPLANYENLIQALKILNAPWGGKIGARKITISTSGLAPQIRRLAAEPLQFRLAISLHGATDEVRGKIMPVNKKYPLNELAAAAEYYQQKRGRMITFEYILIAGVNDHLSQVKPLAQLAQRLHAKVNLIPYNTVEGLPWTRPSEDVQDAFLAALKRENVTATLRREKGHEIDAACGQLRLKTQEPETSPLKFSEKRPPSSIVPN
jgi:23S rRNA (adenine2503-C2)-methyltransferase